MRALLIGPAERDALAALAKLAAEHPVDMTTLGDRLKTDEGKTLHMQQMTLQSIEVPMGVTVCFSIEDGHPIGRCRHLSVSVDAMRNLPHPGMIWALAHLLGFWGELCDCDGFWPERLRQGDAMNLVQRMERP